MTQKTPKPALTHEDDTEKLQNRPVHANRNRQGQTPAQGRENMEKEEEKPERRAQQRKQRKKRKNEKTKKETKRERETERERERKREAECRECRGE